MTCAEARPQISRQLDGALTPSESAALTAHLRGCAACAAVQRAMTEESGALSRHWGRVSAPPGFSSRVAVGLRPRPAASPVRRMLRWRTPALAGALAVLLVAAGVAIPPVRAGIGAFLETVSLRETSNPPPERRLGDTRVIALEEARRRVPWEIQTPGWLPEGYGLAGVVAEEVYTFADGASVTLYYTGGDGADAPQIRILETRVKPGERADLPIEQGTYSPVSVNGRNAILVDGEWQQRDGGMQWVRGTLLRLIVEDGSLLISLEADPREGWDAAGLIRVAESLR